MPDNAENLASPYSTGGGGVALEHAFGAMLLSHLMSAEPFIALGEGFRVTQLSFQAARISPVDDLVVEGESDADGGVARRIFIAIRRAPRISQKDSKFRELTRRYIKVTLSEWSRIREGRLRLGLAVGVESRGSHNLVSLTQIARSHSSNANFREAINSPKATTNAVRRALQDLDATVGSAFTSEPLELQSLSVEEITWRMLSGLFVIPARLEAGDAADVASSIRRLSFAGAADESEATALFDHLYRFAAGYDLNGATVSEWMLRRDLAGSASIGWAPRHRKAWQILADLRARVDSRTGRSLSSEASGQEVRLERTSASAALRNALIASVDGPPTIAFGDPDVGKSALALNVAAELENQSCVVIALSLRDLPTSDPSFAGLLGARMDEVLASAPTVSTKIVLVDGAEAALEGRAEVLTDLTLCARAVGFGVVAVTRTDAKGVVIESLRRGSGQQPHEEQIPALELSEIDAVVQDFPILQRIASDERSRNVLSRPGLIDVLLRFDAVSTLPDSALSEADVLAAVWPRLIGRDRERRVGEPAPEVREAALLRLAEEQLGLNPEPFAVNSLEAIPSLRLDGVLFSAGSTSAWNISEQFANDLIRDFALARLFIKNNSWSHLVKANAPRWAIRAVRLAVQARLQRDTGETNQERRKLVAELREVASQFGGRWAELPMEAILTVGSPDSALESAWPDLVAGDSKGIASLIRLVDQRYTFGEISIPLVAEPLVRLLGNHREEVADFHWKLKEKADDLKLPWLRGLAARGVRDEPIALRASFRDQVLASDREWLSEDDIETLALLGPDMNIDVVEVLVQLAQERPAFLGPAVDRFPATTSLAQYLPDVLIFLAERYFIELPTPDPFGGSSLHEDGVRGHHRRGGLREPSVAWYYGPFWDLLRVKPVHALALINRILDHAVKQRPGPSFLYESQEPEEPKGREFNLPSIGRRTLYGGINAWTWYRGSSVGPYSAMSALLAVERYADQVHAQGIALETVSRRLLQDANNIAMLGLVVGFLVRHLDEVKNELDPLLGDPVVWNLEFGRALRDGEFQVQGPDDTSLHGLERRKMSFREVGAQLATRALFGGDEARLAEFDTIASSLVQTVRESLPDNLEPAQVEDELETIRNWASVLRPDHYAPVKLTDDRIALQFLPPEPSSNRAAMQSEIERGSQVFRWITQYGIKDDRRAGDISALLSDLRNAQDLHAAPVEFASEMLQDGLAAVAASAVIAFTNGELELSEHDAAWAAEMLLQCAYEASGKKVRERNFMGYAAGRSAAIALPRLLSPRFVDSGWLDAKDMKAITKGLKRVLNSDSDEVRRATTMGFSFLWETSCSQHPLVGSCHHALALGFVQNSVRSCFMGERDSHTGRRTARRIGRSLVLALDDVQPENLNVLNLTAVLELLCDCSTSPACVAKRCLPLRDAVIRNHARSAAGWVHKYFQLTQSPDPQRATSACMLRLAGKGDVSAFEKYTSMVAVEPTAFFQYSHDVARSATYDSAQRVALRLSWPRVMSSLLDHLEAGTIFTMIRDSHRDEREISEAIAAILPKPQIRVEDKDPQKVLDSVKGDWVDSLEIQELIPRWISQARGLPQAVDAAVGYADTYGFEEQPLRGFDLVLEVVDGQYESIAGHTWLLNEWLERLSANHQLSAEQMANFQKLVDGLAEFGDWRSAKIQASME